ncbi:MAG: flagellar type III secretion system protein FlhB [Aliishimia sp.]
MSGQDDDAEKSFEPTSKKLEDARKKGDVPKSSDLNTTAAYAGFFLALVMAAPSAMLDAVTGLMVLIDQPAQLIPLFFEGSSRAPMGQALREVIGFLAILFLIPACLVIVSALAQRSIIFAPSKIKPKLSKISPLSNAKQKYGPSGLFEFFKSFLKLTIYSTCLTLFLRARLLEIIATPQLEPAVIMAFLGKLFLSFLAIVIAVSAAIGAIDYMFQYSEHHRKLRMSRKEMMDEAKESEGDPNFKQERRHRGRAIAMNHTLQDVETADVVIVNPTHYAVALHWSREAGQAPTCVAKGVDEFAQAIRERAIEHGVPLHEDPPTARALFATTNVGEEIPQDQYRAVATAVRFAEEMRRKMRAKGYS